MMHGTTNIKKILSDNLKRLKTFSNSFKKKFLYDQNLMKITTKSTAREQVSVYKFSKRIAYKNFYMLLFFYVAPLYDN